MPGNSLSTCATAHGMVTQGVTRPETSWARASLVEDSKAKSVLDNQHKLRRSEMETQSRERSHHQPVTSMWERDRGQTSTLSHFTFLELLEKECLLVIVNLVADLLLRDSIQIFFQGFFTLGC